MKRVTLFYIFTTPLMSGLVKDNQIIISASVLSIGVSLIEAWQENLPSNREHWKKGDLRDPLNGLGASVLS